MPRSDHRWPDGLTKQIEEELTAAGVNGSFLRANHWRDFTKIDRPDTCDCLMLATEAFLHLSIEANGHWNGNLDVLLAILSFLSKNGYNLPAECDMTRLKNLMLCRPVACAEIREWFQRTYLF